MYSCPEDWVKKSMFKHEKFQHTGQTSRIRLAVIVACLSVLLFKAVFPVQASTPFRELRSGWYPHEPYQMEEGTGAGAKVTGLDIQISRELFAQSGHRVAFKPMSWAEILEGLKTGETDFLLGAYYNKSREEFAYYSKPYRTERNDLYYHKRVAKLERVHTVQDVLSLLKKEKLRLAIIEGHAYGSKEFERLVRDPPSNLKLVPSQSYQDNLDLLLEGAVDLFAANPIIMDRLIAEADDSGPVRKLGIKSKEIPVHILFSKQSITREQLNTFNSIIMDMQQQDHIQDLLRDFVLPAYLSITTGQFWFTVLNILGIVSFCTSGVLLARKERYNLFGALVLATLPAIGGGVLRDLFLGVDQVFVLVTPAYFLVAICVVLAGFAIIKSYDFIHDRSPSLAQPIDHFVNTKLGDIFDRLFKFFDAWAVASFTVIGVSIALEMRAEPLWLWGPAMAVVTASGGVILRDIVRADFNIEMLKQDTYAEISFFGGIIFTCALMYPPYEMSLGLIFYLTMAMVLLLFGLRFYILWKGYMNPLQFGDMYTHPDTRLQQFQNKEPELWNIISGYFTDDEQLRTTPVSRARGEKLHNQFLYITGELKDSLDQVAAEPLNEKTITAYRQCNTRLEIATSLENNLFAFLEQRPGKGPHLSADGSELQQLMYETLRTMVDTAAMAIDSRDHMDFSLLEGLTSQYQQRFTDLRDKYSARQREHEDALLKAVLQSTHKVERIIYLLSDYVRLRLDKKEVRAGSATNRKAQQAHLLP
ncbi:MAG: TRIC cation channel family protein [Desulfovermiculus sp.]